MRNDQKLSFYLFCVVVLFLSLPLSVSVLLLLYFWPLLLCTFRFLCVCRARHAINLDPVLFICLKLYLWKRDRMRLFRAENITKVDSTCVLMRIYTLFDAEHQTYQPSNNVKCDDDGTYASGVHQTLVCVSFSFIYLICKPKSWTKPTFRSICLLCLSPTR